MCLGVCCQGQEGPQGRVHRQSGEAVSGWPPSRAGNRPPLRVRLCSPTQPTAGGRRVQAGRHAAHKARQLTTGSPPSQQSPAPQHLPRPSAGLCRPAHATTPASVPTSLRWLPTITAIPKLLQRDTRVTRCLLISVTH